MVWDFFLPYIRDVAKLFSVCLGVGFELSVLLHRYGDVHVQFYYVHMMMWAADLHSPSPFCLIVYPVQGNDSYACLEVAAENGHTQTVEKLLKGRANINYRNKVRTILIKFVLCVVYRLYPNLTCPWCAQLGQTALYCASKKGRVEVVRLLLQWQADAADASISDTVCVCTLT